MAKRILWLFNHTSLRNFELPILKELGYEIYCPKSFTLEFGDYSASVTYEYDQTLTIPKDELNQLNNADLYNTMSDEIMDIVNRYFDIAFCLFYYPTFKNLCRGFRGVICLHAFGLSQPETYTDGLFYRGYFGALSEIRRLGDRFWFAPTYDNLTEIEAPLLKQRSIFLPIGLVNTKIRNDWLGGDKRILFISPKIKTNVYYAKVYEDFKNNFDEIPHVIGGAQPQPVPEDKTVTGFIPDDQYVYNMTHLSAMYYHSQEPYHLHYHPLEAIKWGMPLVFMAGGMLDHLGGKDLPGRCETIEEAKKKLLRLSCGDKALAAKIKATQGSLLKSFSMEYCKPFWIDGMKRIEASIARTTDWKLPAKKRIAVIMPAPYQGGVLDYSIRLCLMLNEQFKKHGANAEVIFAYPDFPVYKEKEYFSPLKQAGIPLRAFVIKTISVDGQKKALKLAGFMAKADCASYLKTVALRDGIADFADCDYSILTADATTPNGIIFNLHPYAVVAHDYIQRYCPECITRDADVYKLANQRHADAVFVTSKPGFVDSIQYAGLPKEKVFLTPLMLEPMEPPKLQSEEDVPNKPYFLWSTNAAPHKNHLRALDALEQYYINGGTMNCVVTGANTKYLGMKKLSEDAPVYHPYVMRVAKRISDSSVLKKHLKIKGELPKINYQQLLSHAAFVFHPGYGDNGNGTAVDAAGMGVPTLSSDYPAMHYLAEFMEMPMRYMNPFRTESMAEALLDMEKNHEIYSQALPSREKLMEHDYRAQGEALYQIIKQVVDV